MCFDVSFNIDCLNEEMWNRKPELPSSSRNKLKVLLNLLSRTCSAFLGRSVFCLYFIFVFVLFVFFCFCSASESAEQFVWKLGKRNYRKTCCGLLFKVCGSCLGWFRMFVSDTQCSFVSILLFHMSELTVNLHQIIFSINCNVWPAKGLILVTLLAVAKQWNCALPPTTVMQCGLKCRW